MSFFTTFGTFSIVAGILLIFLIFVMLAAERRGELGIARAVGTRRGHLVQMFLVRGRWLRPLPRPSARSSGAVVAYGMVLVMAQAFGAAARTRASRSSSPSRRRASCRVRDRRAADPRRRRLSAWRVSVMTIVDGDP